MPRSSSLPLLALALSLFAAPARADEAASDVEVTRRLDFVTTSLESGTAAADRWWYAWYGIFGALTIGEFSRALVATDPGIRVDSAVGAVACSLGVIPRGLFPFPARTAAGSLRAWPEATPEERRRKLKEGERLLRSAAEIEALGRSWMTHTLNITVSIAAGLVLGAGYKRPVTGTINAISGIALTEIQIFTQPTAAIDAWRAYGLGGPAAKATAARSGPTWTLVPQGLGLGFVAQF